jgi:hypothetical protein
MGPLSQRGTRAFRTAKCIGSGAAGLASNGVAHRGSARDEDVAGLARVREYDAVRVTTKSGAGVH